MNDPAFQLFSILKEISSCCQERELLQAKAKGLTPAEGRTLIALKLYNIRSTAELAERLFVAKSRVTRILDGLVNKGFVKRSEDTADRRKCLVQLTPPGIRLVNNLFDDILSVHRELMNSLPAERKDTFFVCLNSLRNSMNVVKERLSAEITEK